ncbi:MAG: hypothetical protein M1818_004664 [Claussenomyces sp. TS43310]|nr:MAG: hypothetical protein M1818_004664 [Claussenomyces sp. TS43310]
MASVTPRRSARIKEMLTPSPTPGSNGSTTAASQKPAYRPWPFRPTSIETILLVIYPATLVLGSLFALIDPSARNAPYSAVTQSHPSELAPSYFAKKSNLFNQIFVKRGWFWVTASFFLFLLTHPSTGPSRSLVLTPKRIQGAIRWGIVTLWWVLVTQWCFGPPLIDRGFTLTGGQCELVREADEGMVDMDGTRQLFTGMACKAVGGRWKGGHDISGHVFLLVLGSMFLFEEVLNVMMRMAGSEERTIVMGDGAVKSAEAEASITEDAVVSGAKWNWGVKAVLGVGGLSLWMLLMTAAYFHTWFEKFTGLLVAYSGIFVVYFLPRVVPAMREVVGMPGI